MVYSSSINGSFGSQLEQRNTLIYINFQLLELGVKRPQKAEKHRIFSLISRLLYPKISFVIFRRRNEMIFSVVRNSNIRNILITKLGIAIGANCVGWRIPVLPPWHKWKAVEVTNSAVKKRFHFAFQNSIFVAYPCCDGSGLNIVLGNPSAVRTPNVFVAG